MDTCERSKLHAAVLLLLHLVHPTGLPLLLVVPGSLGLLTPYTFIKLTL